MTLCFCNNVYQCPKKDEKEEENSTLVKELFSQYVSVSGKPASVSRSFRLIYY